MSTPAASSPSVTELPLPKRGTKAYDLLCATPLLLWYAFNLAGQSVVLRSEVARIAATRTGMPELVDVVSRGTSLLFAGLLVALLLRRRPPVASTGAVFARIAAISGTCLPLLLLMLPRQPSTSWMVEAGTLLMIIGMGFAVYSLIFLGTSFSIMSEARKLVTGGPYSIVRHPLYLGEQTAILGMMLQVLSPVAVVLVLVQIIFQLYRMRYEETLLARTFPEYRNYSARTHRIIPLLY